MEEISEEELNNMFDAYTGTMRNRIQCKVEFYKAIHHLQYGAFALYEDHIKRCVQLTGKYLEFAYYIAKVELDVYLASA